MHRKVKALAAKKAKLQAEVQQRDMEITQRKKKQAEQRAEEQKKREIRRIEGMTGKEFREEWKNAWESGRNC